MRCVDLWSTAASRLLMIASIVQMLDRSTAADWPISVVDDETDGGHEEYDHFVIGGIDMKDNVDVYAHAVPFADMDTGIQNNKEEIFKESFDDTPSSVDATDIAKSPFFIPPVVFMRGRAPPPVTAMPSWIYFLTAVSVLFMPIL